MVMRKPHFTKWPWMAIKLNLPSYPSPHPCWHVSDKKGIAIAEINASSHKKMKANAFLLAAAPEMYNLLESIKAQLEFAELEREIDVELEHRIENVLAKARGEVKNEQKK